MLFNSIDFAIFLPIVFLLYWLVFNKSLGLQNFFLVVVSYIFYGWWEWKFLGLIFISSLLDYLIGLGFLKYDKEKQRKLLLYTSVTLNLGILFTFKYYDFFISNFVNVFSFFGNKISITHLDIILPVGISFYTFQTLSYSIDVYQKKLKPTKDIVSFFAFVSFFPQLVAGPIEKASNLLPQFFAKRQFHYSNAVDGMRQILWGLFKKIIIADKCALFVNIAFNNTETNSGSVLVLGAIFFAFQIYCDFSGYSDIAIGVSRFFGFNLMQNFNFPYFSRDIAEFWRRWHISLSSWFKDYLYIPLGGNQKGKFILFRNVFIVFILSGLWHGANWTFIVWGALNATGFFVLMLTNKSKTKSDDVAKNAYLPSLKELVFMFSTFSFVTFCWIFFRANNINHAFQYIKGIFSTSLFSIPNYEEKTMALITFINILFLMLIEWNGRTQNYGIAKLGFNWNPFYRKLFYFVLALLILLFSGSKQEFIYFQF